MLGFWVCASRGSAAGGGDGAGAAGASGLREEAMAR
uniref:Uncharacterized protein n=1 Tax=Arundo donax TaxID=35708 RepID=A0A0A9G708_ARUDO